MPTLVGFQEPTRGCEPLTKPLDAAAWQAWEARNRAQALRRSATRIKTVKWAAVVILVAATVFGSRLAFYGVIVRFVLTLAAIVVMSDAVHFRHYTFATVFGTLALLYNPVLPLVNFSGFWQCSLIILSAVLFIVSLAWPRVKLAHYDYRCDVGIYSGPKRSGVTAINVNTGEARGIPMPAAKE